MNIQAGLDMKESLKISNRMGKVYKSLFIVGVYYYPDGSFYKGIFKNGLANGKGRLERLITVGVFRYSCGDEFEGTFVNDKANGVGF